MELETRRVISSRPKSTMEKFNENFSLPNRPIVEMPEIPENLDELSDASLMEVYRVFMGWMSFAKSDIVQAEIIEERSANDLKVVEAEILIGQWGITTKGDTVTLAKARRDVDPEVIKYQNKHLEARAYRKLVDSVFERCERGAQLLSRELSRRISMAPQERRHSKYMP